MKNTWKQKQEYSTFLKLHSMIIYHFIVYRKGDPFDIWIRIGPQYLWLVARDA